MIDPRCITELRGGEASAGPILYWMSRDQRVEQNRALLLARERAVAAGERLLVAFTLSPTFIGATLRHYDFMLRGLEETEERLGRLGIGFVLLEGDPPAEIVRFVLSSGAGLLVTDYSPLRISRRWKESVRDAVAIPFLEVDAHNIVPCLLASPKQEWAARTFRPKVNRLLGEFLRPLPPVEPVENGTVPEPTDWEAVRSRLTIDRSVGPVPGMEPGEAAAGERLRRFIREGLPSYAERKNDPNAGAASGLSPYLHFGHIWAGEVALGVMNSRSPEVLNSRGPEDPSGGGELSLFGDGTAQAEAFEASKASFLEELVVRRELSENYCARNPLYDSFEGLAQWARQSLAEHDADPREALYGREEFEQASTHDELWNAAQRELVRTGTIHGYMRMYWAKKILEWSPSPREAFETALWLNDRYALDGRDPNGYVGVAWAVGGLHDRPWFERPVYGKIRYMNEAGCRRKFDVRRYIGRQG
ncbi:deoxyribodipyrimidine photo-lyase [Chlorobium sp. N1]|uniref:deoxyribodipyrimidine photo-lyase n=1 Tax=Chlorobium sp. N1 TaxID=2491138 RepID=UPI00103E90D3|nr:deoxyribodipyrimidine photo-lyase [Chlorobium sp. N1]TCD47242.1 deoxyribodipyrimidine photolyase [Chlorobium sp. N1]